MAAVPSGAGASGPTGTPGARLLDLVAVMDRLRSPGGCPWDGEQTHASLVTYLLEEAYETVEAIEAGDDTMLREELGDLLLQVVFHARIAQERAEAPWSIDDVADGIVTKLVRRHPHVFADAEAPTAADVEATWHRAKAVEKGRTSPVDGVPLAQPALALAAKLLGRVAAAGGVPAAGGGGTTSADAGPAPAAVRAAEGLGRSSYVSEEALGEALFAVVARAREAGLNPERALRAAARRYATAIRAAATAPDMLDSPDT
jgi:XTP/dITP diphosphohydrolase